MHVLTSRTIIHPSDLEASLTFYGSLLDLPVAREFGAGAGRGVVFFAGGGLIEVVGPHDPPQPRGPSGSSAQQVVALWLQVRSVADTAEELTGRGVELARGATLEPWGLIEAWVDDPDGIRIHLVEVPAEHPLRRDQRDLAIGGGRQ